MSQRDDLAAALQIHGGITVGQARYRGITSLRRRIYDLRRRGWEIATCTDWHTDTGHRDGARHGHYVLVAEPGQPPRQIEAGL